MTHQQDTPQPQAADSVLPMVVWLHHGDSLRDTFTMDADAVMDELGIKRSRLTQISGKDLRVGRLRIDKYTKPFYRPEDVAEYKTWTRATASHQKSALAIDSALARLDQQVEDLGQTVVSPLAQLREEISELLTKGFSRSHAQQQRNFLTAAELLERILIRLELAAGRERGQREHLRGLLAASDKIATGQIQQGVELKDAAAEILAAIREYLAGSDEAKMQTWDLIKDLKTALTEAMEEKAASVREQMGRLAEQGTQLRDELLSLVNERLTTAWDQILSERMNTQHGAIIAEMRQLVEAERQARQERDERFLALMSSLHASVIDVMAQNREVLETRLVLRQDLMPGEFPGELEQEAIK